MKSKVSHFPKVAWGRSCDLVIVFVLTSTFASTLGRFTAAGESAPPSTPGTIGGVLDGVGIAPQMGRQVPLDLKFVDEAGQHVNVRDSIANRPTILQLVYYQCPMLCQLSRDGLMSTLATIRLKPGQDFSVITLSFDPREGPELSARARQLAIERFGRAGVEAGWNFLTGDGASISALAEAVGFRYTFDEKTGQFAHAAGIFVLTPEGKVLRFLSGADYSPRDLRLALVEASSNKIGSVADQALLLCYMYDPTSGKYGLAIMSLMRIAGLATVAFLAGGIVLMIRRERARLEAVASFSIDRAPIREPFSK
jgi:protein SCO1